MSTFGGGGMLNVSNSSILFRNGTKRFSTTTLAKIQCNLLRVGKTRVASFAFFGLGTGFAFGLVGNRNFCNSFALCEGAISLDKGTDSILSQISSNKKDTKEVERQKLAGKDAEKLVTTTSPWSHIWDLILKNKFLFAVAAIASITGSLCLSASARVLGDLFDIIGTRPASEYWAALKKLGLLYTTHAGCVYVSSLSLAYATTSLGKDLRNRFFKAILRQDIEFFDKNSSGAITHQLGHDIGALQTSLRTAFTSGVQGLSSLVSCSVYLYLTSPKLSLAMFGLLPLMGGLANVAGHFLRGYSKRVKKATAEANSIASEAIQNVRTVRSFNAETREQERYNASLAKAASMKYQMAVFAGSFYSAVIFGINASTLFICLYGGHLVSTGEVTKGGIAAGKFKSTFVIFYKIVTNYTKRLNFLFCLRSNYTGSIP